MLRVFTVLIFITLTASPLLKAQKSLVIAAFQLIETEKFEEAKKAIEEALEDDRTKNWYRSWHAKGLLCQRAYEKGKKAKPKDKAKYELYPDQLKLAYESYEKALALDTRGRINESLAPLYVRLANDLKKTGKENFSGKNYTAALESFETALKINESPILSVKIDSNLIYNTALAAYKSEEWDKAIQYLDKLNKSRYSPNVPKLLYQLYLEKPDTALAENALIEGLRKYNYNEELVLLLSELYYNSKNLDKSIEVLDTAAGINPSKYIFPYTKGLIYQKEEQYDNAIEAFKKALDTDTTRINIYADIATCYFNKGVEIDEYARTIKNNRIYNEQKAKSTEAFRSAITWFERAYEKKPKDQKIIEPLYNLYSLLGIDEKIEDLEKKLE